MTPSVGRTVHYVSRGSADGHYPPLCRAAIITEVVGFPAHPGGSHALVGEEASVSLRVFNPEGDFWPANVRYDAMCAPGTWHWPERV